ncbi:NAD(P)H-dependent oxidoreductase [Mycolicibacillus parakoreensis]|uniref:NAD(P)H-dependent oxidoreductase n=1 Tax=Mycolicibacillus parakoreensis TaxID=1069221 RepID=A0ABY3U1D6_9MYCO|nr:CE1759 family FMN reductase [Mycolicibacillus parakoreensis]MCV7314338.1 NAD(P)H-dependent oxidoreductase [Mycolicibacillus parakoreensis]ULN53312.1 NAD(P)H-dependent oxidoreductase [Mycolicibacillus parakoreensis]HLR99630.1 CE1759 family FMN reductase [Mycolicibacillus parakoreensis]
MTTVTVVSAGVREPSSTRLLADRLAAAVRAAAAGDAGPVGVTVIDLRVLGRAIVDAMATGVPAPQLAAAFDAVAGADGLIAVTPAFNASFSGLFKAFFDVLPQDTLAGMPVLIAATGGTERHSLVLDHALRPLFAYLRALVAPTGVYAATGDFGARQAALNARIDRAGAEFARLLGAAGPSTRRDGEAEDLAAMRQLLADTGPAGERAPGPSRTVESTDPTRTLDRVSTNGTDLDTPWDTRRRTDPTRPRPDRA